jgi:hypothetical protein
MIIQQLGLHAKKTMRLAVVNINTATVTSLLPLGFKNHNLIGNGLDPSDRSLNNTTAQAA